MILTVDWSRGPHIRRHSSVRLAMLEHAFALAPGVTAAAFYHGAGQLLLVATTVIAALATQELLKLLLKRQRSLPDGRTAVSGLVLALLLPLNTVWWAGALAGALGMLATGLLEYSKLRLKVNPVVPGVFAATAFAAWMPDSLFSGG
ncbi:MAG TPA: RnfABCDGE type electron transport complex subunit D, partial [Bacillota bacterium]|nr:RnfABCDGE type electron transport complex subunit D [Bacillota bacterium]